MLVKKGRTTLHLEYPLLKADVAFMMIQKEVKEKINLFTVQTPQKKMKGMKFYLKSNTGLVDTCFEKYGSKYNLLSSESFYIDSDKDLIFEPNLYEILGSENYRNLLTDIANEIK